MSKKVYVVTQGRYSDYHIEAIFLDKELAEEFVDIRNKDLSLFYKMSVEAFTVSDETFRENKDKDVWEADLSIEDDTMSFNKILPYEYYPYYDHTEYRSSFNYIEIVRSFPKGKYTEEEIKERMSKAIFDIMAIVKDLKAQGATGEEIEAAINGKGDDTEND